MHRPLVILLVIFLVCVGLFRHDEKNKLPDTILRSRIPTRTVTYKKLLSKKAMQLHGYARRNGYATNYAFLIDMSLPSGKNRFFIYDMKGDSIKAQGLVAHGSCQEGFREHPSFNNTVGSGCSSLGRYKVGYSYQGNFGKAFKLFGLDKTNNNAFERYVVLHAYSCVPDQELYPAPLCNSLGCPMVSYGFLSTAAQYIESSRKPLLLWIYG